MRYFRKLSAGVLALATVLGVTVSVAPEAVASQPPACVAELKLGTPDPASDAAKHPVLMIHGWSSGPGAFDALEKTVSKVSEVKTLTFDYREFNTRWVTDPEIGQRLAKTIVCYSKLYKNRLILVAHSMGSLASREALGWADSGVFAKNVVGHAVTIGAPHLGTAFADADAEFWLAACKAPFAPAGPIMVALVDGPCRTIESSRATSGMQIDSDQLAKLAKFPPNVSVKAIAGDATWRVCAPWGCAKADTDSDLVVAVDSATNQFTETKKGDGKTVFACETAIPFSPLTDAPCDHNKMLNAEQVQQEVKKSIEDYIASTKKPAIPSTDFFGLKLQIGSDWEVLKAPDDPLTAERKIVVSKKSCGPQDFKMYCNGFVVAKMGGDDPKMSYKDGASCNYNWVHDDLGWSEPKTVGKVTYGGVEGEHFIQENDCRFDEGTVQPKDPRGDTLHGWKFPSKGVVVYDSESSDRASTNPFPGVEKLLQGASWK